MHISVNLLYYAAALLVYNNFILLAKNWKDLLQYWENTERLLSSEVDTSYKEHLLRKKIKVITFVIFGFALGTCEGFYDTKMFLMLVFNTLLVELILDRVTGYYKMYECRGFGSRMEAYSRQFFPEFFTFVPFNIYTGILAFLGHLYCTISTNYVDLFLIVLCKSLKEQFKIVNNAILRTPIRVSLNYFKVYTYY